MGPKIPFEFWNGLENHPSMIKMGYYSEIDWNMTIKHIMST